MEASILLSQSGTATRNPLTPRTNREQTVKNPHIQTGVLLPWRERAKHLAFPKRGGYDSSSLFLHTVVPVTPRAEGEPTHETGDSFPTRRLGRHELADRPARGRSDSPDAPVPSSNFGSLFPRGKKKTDAE